LGSADRPQSALREAAQRIWRYRRAEIVDDFDGDTFRAVYTVRFAKAAYVLHAFQKKSKRGAATPRTELDLIDQRLRRAREDYEQWSKSEKPISR
jgi:phage-related protein